MGSSTLVRRGTRGVTFVHPLAEVARNTKLGAGCKVWQFASVIRGAELGEDCSVGGCAIVDGARVGDRCLIGHGAQVHPGVEIGSDVFVGPGAVFCNDAWPSADKAGWEADRFAGGMVTVRVGNGAGIGANAVVLPGVRLGERSFVAAGAVCDQSVPADHLFKRSGAIVEINTAWARKRMKAAA